MNSAETIIRGGLVCDGTGTEPVFKDILIRNDRIAEIGPRGTFDNVQAEVIDAGGKLVTPGFIDAHSHDDLRILQHPEIRTKLLQGVTTVICGNCGSSPSCVPGKSGDSAWQDLAGYAETVNAVKAAVNTAALCGHNSIRRAVMGNAGRRAEPAEIAKMRQLLEAAFSAGAAGFTTGLTYFPGKFADTGELTALSAVMKGTGKVYATHMRSEGDALLEAVDEAFTVADAGSGRLEISHLKTIFPRNFHKIGPLLEKLKKRRESGRFLCADRYPYIYSSTRIGQILPAPYDRDTEIKARLADSENFRREITEALRNSPRDLASTILMKSGKTLSQIAEENHCPLEEAGMRVLLENPDQPAAYLCMSESNMMRILAEPWVCAGSDGLAMQLDDPAEQGHPRSCGTFPTFFRLVSKLVSVHEAVRRMTALPAEIFRIPDRGLLRKGFFADLVLLDAENYDSHAGFDGRNIMPSGVSLVMVNGQTAWDAGEPGKVGRAGRFLPVD